MAKTWEEKLQDTSDEYPKILKLEKKFPCYKALSFLGVKEGEDIVITKKAEVLDVMMQVPKGKLMTIHELCLILGEKHNVKAACSLTTGIFTMTVANAEDELKKDYRGYGVPYWRTLKANGELNPKYPGGLEAHKKLLEKEGFEIEKRGKRWFVKDFEKHLV